MPRAPDVAAVNIYRCYYLDSANHIVATGVIQCDTQAEAQARAGILLAGSDHCSIEVWDRDQMVCRVTKTDGLVIPE
jgi:hypothetical protein